MAYRFRAADVAFLGSVAGRTALAEAATLPLTDATLLADLTALRRSAGEGAAALAETIRLRRRAAERWQARGPATTYDGVPGDAPSRWLYTDEALQQASPPAVAAHRARRLARLAAETGAAGCHDLTCSIGADLAALAAAGIFALGSDLDEVRLAMAGHNLAAAGLTAPLLRADARTVTSRRLLRYADPARRDASGRRITSADTVPSVTELDAADPGRPPVLRLPPGIDYEGLGRGGEIELVSWRGAVREAVSWPAMLAGEVSRRATILGEDGTAEQVTDLDPAEDTVINISGSGEPAARRYLIDPDPAVVRAHLVRQYAARYGLCRFDEHLAYLTGDTPPPRMRAFEILAAAPFTERAARAWVRQDGVGTLEIKQRGTPIVPDELRRRLRPGGDRHIARTLVIARIGRGPVAFWCRAVGPAP